MSDWIADYVKTVKYLFPIMGPPEKNYLKLLTANMKDYFSYHAPSSPEEIVAQFGPPESVVNDYLLSAEPDYLLERMRRAKRWRLLTVCALVALLAAVAICSYLLWLEYSSYLDFMNTSFGYTVETIE